MRPSLDGDLDKMYQAFNQDHDELRQDLMACLGEHRERGQAAVRNKGVLTSIEHMMGGRRIAKLAVAAVIVVAVCIGVAHLGGIFDASNVAWANVVRNVADVDYVHVYWLRSRSGELSRAYEVWYDSGRVVYCGNDGDVTYDDGRISQYFNSRGIQTVRCRSRLAYCTPFFEWISGGLLSHVNPQLSEHIPTSVGDDFLIYTFDAPSLDSDWLQRLVITVGRDSLLPIQKKAMHENGDYDLFIYDYDAPRKSSEFFEPPLTPPNGVAEVLLDGEEVVVDVEGAPGLKYAIVRLHSKYDGPADQFPPDYIHSDGLSEEFCRAVSVNCAKRYAKGGGPVFRCDVSFVTDEGYLSRTLDSLVLQLDEAKQCGVGGKGGKFRAWPDGKFRNVRFSPWLKPTDREDIFIVEMRCWMKTE